MCFLHGSAFSFTVLDSGAAATLLHDGLALGAATPRWPKQPETMLFRPSWSSCLVSPLLHFGGVFSSGSPPYERSLGSPPGLPPRISTVREEPRVSSHTVEILTSYHTPSANDP